MSFSFPTNLSLEEIQASMADMQVYIDPSQLSKPTYEVVRPCFEQAVIALTGVTRWGLLGANYICDRSAGCLCFVPGCNCSCLQTKVCRELKV